MITFTTFFRCDPIALAALINGAPTVVLHGLDPADLQEADWMQPCTPMVEPNPTPDRLAAEISRMSNQRRIAFAIGWVLTLCATGALSHVFTAR